jgi:hypothetical protein
MCKNKAEMELCGWKFETKPERRKSGKDQVQCFQGGQQHQLVQQGQHVLELPPVQDE